jgi:hypothetical protein
MRGVSNVIPSSIGGMLAWSKDQKFFLDEVGDTEAEC